jgi:hypothetical protein
MMTRSRSQEVAVSHCCTFALSLAACALASTFAIAAEPDSSEVEYPPAFQGQPENEYREYPDPEPGAPEARLRVVFDLVSGSQELAVEPGQPFDVYVVAHDVQIALRAWEATLVIDPRLSVLERKIPAEINVGQGNEVIAALKPRDCLSGTPIVLASLKLVILDEGLTDLVIGLGPIASPSIPSVPTEIEGPMPVYLTCRPGADLRPFDFCKICAVVNPRNVRPERDVPRPEPLRDLLEPIRGRS